ncbi:MAG TPA: ATP-binding protein [Solirubrobacteraceae bacterium]|nr:ATP-binding protein [Solirubrobacteraceae bacterium]
MATKLSGRVDVGNLVRTPTFQRAQQAASSTLRHAGISLFYGAPGLGKTVAVRRFAESLEQTKVAYLAAAGSPTLAAFARALASELTGIQELEREMLYSLTQMLREVLWTGVEVLVIVDEAQRLSLHHFEYLRDLHDHENAAFSLLLVGNHEAWTVIQQRPMLLDRILHRLHFEPLKAEELFTFLPRYDVMYATAAETVIARVARAAMGQFRWLAMFTMLARDALQRAGRDTLDEDIVDAVLLLMARSEAA